MSKQAVLDFSPPKTLADYPLLTRHYEQMSDQGLESWRKDMAHRVDKPHSGWCKEFAHFHLEAISLEIEKRKQSKNNQ